MKTKALSILKTFLRSQFLKTSFSTKGFCDSTVIIALASRLLNFLMTSSAAFQRQTTLNPATISQPPPLVNAQHTLLPILRIQPQVANLFIMQNLNAPLQKLKKRNLYTKRHNIKVTNKHPNSLHSCSVKLPQNVTINSNSIPQLRTYKDLPTLIIPYRFISLPYDFTHHLTTLIKNAAHEHISPARFPV